MGWECGLLAVPRGTGPRGGVVGAGERERCRCRIEKGRYRVGTNKCRVGTDSYKLTGFSVGEWTVLHALHGMSSSVRKCH